MFSNWSPLVSVQVYWPEQAFILRNSRHTNSHGFTVSFHDFIANLMVSQLHKLISWAGNFAVWISTNTVLTMWVAPISYLQGQRIQCDVGNGCQVLLTTEEGGMFIRRNHIYNCVSKCWWHQASIEVFSNTKIVDLLMVGVTYEWFYWGHTHL